MENVEVVKEDIIEDKATKKEMKKGIKLLLLGLFLAIALGLTILLLYYAIQNFITGSLAGILGALYLIISIIPLSASGTLIFFIFKIAKYNSLIKIKNQ